MIAVDRRALVRELTAAVREDASLRRELVAALGVEHDAACYLTVAEYARRRSIGASTVRAAIRLGKLEAARIGRSIRVRADAVIGKPATAASSTARAERRLGLVAGGAQ